MPPRPGAPEPADAELVSAAQLGDGEALETLLVRSYGSVLRIARRVLPNPEDAAEAAQESMLRTVEGLKGLRDVASFPWWLSRIVRNVCLSMLQRRPPRTTTDPDGAVRSAEDEAIERDGAAAVRRCISRLSTADRKAIVVRDLQGLPPSELAAVLGTSEGAARVRHHRARERLRREIVREGIDVGAAHR